MHADVTMKNYVSEYGQFMENFLGRHPEVVADQRKGWNIFWDRKVDFDEWKKTQQDTVPTPPYYYF